MRRRGRGGAAETGATPPSFSVLDAWPLALLVLPLAGCAASAPASGSAEAAGTDLRFAHTLTVDAPPEAVWRLWTDVSTWHAWDPEVESATLDGPYAVGATGRLVPASGPSSTFRVTEADPDSATTFETRLPLGSLRVRRSWQGRGGRTEITHTVSFHGLGGRMLARRLGPRFRAALPGVMGRLKALAEGGAGP